MNKVAIIGRLTKDAELKSASNNTYILRGTIAVNNPVKKDGAWTQEPSFIDFTWFGERAGKWSQYLLKGSQIGIDGKLKQDRWTDKDGSNKSKIQIIVDNVTLLGGKKDSENNGTTIDAGFQDQDLGDIF